MQDKTDDAEASARYADYVQQCTAHLGDESSTGEAEATARSEPLQEEAGRPYFFEGQLSQVNQQGTHSPRLLAPSWQPPSHRRAHDASVIG